MGKRQNRQYKKQSPIQPSDCEEEPQDVYLSGSAQEQSKNDLSQSSVQDLSSLAPDRSNEDLNIKVVRSYNPEIFRIMSLAPYAVIYSFNTSTASWEKSGVEGTMFVCELVPGRLGEDRYTVFVLNRRGLNNFECQLVNGDDVELTPEYIILRIEVKDADGNLTCDPSIVGIWIYTEAFPNSTSDARALNAQIIKECATHAGDSLKLAKERATLETQPAERAGTESIHLRGRQISLHEMFGQQREQDDAWTVHAHDSTSGEEEQSEQHGARPGESSNVASDTQGRLASTGTITTGNPVLDQLFAKAAHGK
ncbi:hypothetical protein KEM54_000747 [Ascosphaera aggregata]|nr:hypothetical protein KEM54_000747 [Ascosphaera aggregata]